MPHASFQDRRFPARRGPALLTALLAPGLGLAVMAACPNGVHAQESTSPPRQVTTYGPPPESATLAPALAEGPAAPPNLDGPGAASVGDDGVLVTRPPDGDSVADRDPSCRVGGEVDMGIAGGGGVLERGVGTTLTYGKDGNPFVPCDDSHISMALSVSSSWGSGTPRYGGYGYGGYGYGYGPGGYAGYYGPGPMRLDGPGWNREGWTQGGAGITTDLLGPPGMAPYAGYYGP